MADSGSFTAALLDATGRAWAAACNARLRERNAPLAEALGRARARDAATLFEGLLEHMATALSWDAAVLFHEHVRWLHVSCAARGLPAQTLPLALECLREELADRLPGEAARRIETLLTPARAIAEEPRGSFESTLAGTDPATERARRYLLAALEGRRQDALELVLSEFERGVSVAELHREVIARAQIEIGRMWHHGELSIVEEHLVTRLSEQVLTVLGGRMPRAERNGMRVLVTSASGDLHDLGLRMVADQFDMAGWDTIYLGASTPSEEVAQAALDFDIDVAAVGAQLALHVRPLAALIAALRAEPRTRTLPVIVGGRPFGLVPELWRKLGADGCAASAPEAVELAARLAIRRPGTRS